MSFLNVRNACIGVEFLMSQVDRLYKIDRMRHAEGVAALAQVAQEQQTAGGGFDSSWIVDLRERTLLPSAVTAFQV